MAATSGCRGLLCAIALSLAAWSGAGRCSNHSSRAGDGACFPGRLISAPPFSLNVGMTVARALESFLIIVVSGTLLGLLAGFFPVFQAAMSPLLTVLKATPVMSVILLAFIWFSSGTVPIFSAFLMGFPIMFIQIAQSVAGMDPALEQMCRIYGFSPSLRLRHYVLPSLLPALVTGARLTLSMVWKVVVAAEVLPVPRHGIGSRLQMAQVNLETSDVLAWTLVAVLLTALGDLFFDVLLVTGRRLAPLSRTSYCSEQERGVTCASPI